MSSPNDFPEGVDYVDNVDKILSSVWTDFLVGNSADPLANGISAVRIAYTGGFASPFIAQKLSFYNRATNPIPTDFNALFTELNSYAVATAGPAQAVLANTSVTAIKAAFYKTFAYSILERQGNQSDWAGIINVTSPTIDAQFENAWKEFVKTIPYDSFGFIDMGYSGPNNEVFTDSGQVLLSAFSKFLSIGTKIQNTTVVTTSKNGTTVTTISVPSWEDMYAAFFGTNVGFAAFVQQFYQDALAKTGGGDPLKGFFIPSQQFGAFIDAVAKQAKAVAMLNAPASVTTDQSGRPAVINRIFRILVLLITTLQGVAAAQANRLSLFTQWTRAYTDMMNQVPKFLGNNPNSILRDDGVGDTKFYSSATVVLKDDPAQAQIPVPGASFDYSRIHWNFVNTSVGSNYLLGPITHILVSDPDRFGPGLFLVPIAGPIGQGTANRTVTIRPSDIGDKAKRASIRQELNDGISAQVTERMRSYRDAVSNDSKAQQSSVNQTNDAVNQQTNMATALLQTLSTLLASIYR